VRDAAFESTKARRSLLIAKRSSSVPSCLPSCSLRHRFPQSMTDIAVGTQSEVTDQGREIARLTIDLISSSSSSSIASTLPFLEDIQEGGPAACRSAKPRNSAWIDDNATLSRYLERYDTRRRFLDTVCNSGGNVMTISGRFVEGNDKEKEGDVTRQRRGNVSSSPTCSRSYADHVR